MKVGGRRKLVLPPSMGYGDAGAPPDIPPGSTLVFDVEVLGVE
jgi:FKBP-type peptidyl-prolyl cis-trans isomerase